MKQPDGKCDLSMISSLTEYTSISTVQESAELEGDTPKMLSKEGKRETMSR